MRNTPSEEAERRITELLSAKKETKKLLDLLKWHAPLVKPEADSKEISELLEWHAPYLSKELLSKLASAFLATSHYWNGEGGARTDGVGVPQWRHGNHFAHINGLATCELRRRGL